MCHATEGHDRYWIGFLPSADAVLAELGLTQAAPRTGLVAQLYDSTQLSTLPKWCRDLMEKAADALTTPQASPQASAEDVALVDGVIRRHVEWHEPVGVTAAWQRIAADYERMGVVK
jgi:hypothetical protein